MTNEKKFRIGKKSQKKTEGISSLIQVCFENTHPDHKLSRKRSARLLQFGTAFHFFMNREKVRKTGRKDAL